MRAEVNTVRHLAAEPRAGAPVQIRHATFVCRHRQAIQLIDVATALHTEVLNGLKRAAVIQRAQRKPPALLNKRAGVIRIQHGNRHAHGAPRDLHAGIHNAGVRLFLRFCRQQKHAVCQIIKRFVVHFAPPFKIVIILIFIIADNWQKVKPYFRCIYKKERRANRSFSLCSVLLFFSNDSKTSRLGNPCNWVSYGSNVHRTFEPTFLVFGYAKRFRFLRKANQGSALITCKFSEENLTKDF